MKIVHTLTLSQEQAHNIRRLTALCQKKDGTALSCPLDGDGFWLLYGKNKDIRAFLAVYEMDASTWECSAFTHPDFRGQGYFRALLEQACRDSRAEGEPDLCFVTDNRSPAALKVLLHLGAESLYDEYMMEIDPSLAQAGPPVPDQLFSVSVEPVKDSREMCFSAWVSPALAGPGLSLCTGADASGAPFSSAPGAPFGSAPGAFPGFAPGALPAGSCRIAIQGTGAYLYGLEIQPGLRGKGLGTRFICQILSMLKEQGCRSLRLQVSGANAPALGLYRKTGFHITETLSYYLY